MRYPAFIETTGDGTFWIGFPDVPGCVSAAASVEEAIEQGTEALAMHFEGMAEDGDAMPRPRAIAEHRADPEFADVDVWVVVEADRPQAASKAVRLNITLPERTLVAVDAAAQREGLTRSGWLKQAAAYQLRSGGAVRTKQKPHRPVREKTRKTRVTPKPA